MLHRAGIRSTRRRAGVTATPVGPGEANDAEKEGVEDSIEQEALCVDGITKTFGNGRQAKTVVDDVSLGVSEDTIFAILGPNGAGKTTTFNMIREPQCYDICPSFTNVIL